MKKFIGLMLAFVIFCFTACAGQGEKEITVVKNQTPVEMQTPEIKSEIEREFVNLIDYDNGYAIFTVQRRRTSSAGEGGNKETAEIVVYDVHSKQVVMYKNIDLKDGNVTGAIYNNNVLYYAYSNYGDDRLFIRKIDGINETDITFDTQPSYTGSIFDFEVDDGVTDFEIETNDGTETEYVITGNVRKAVDKDKDFKKSYTINTGDDKLIMTCEMDDYVFVVTDNRSKGKVISLYNIRRNFISEIGRYNVEKIWSDKDETACWLQTENNKKMLMLAQLDDDGPLMLTELKINLTDNEIINNVIISDDEIVVFINGASEGGENRIFYSRIPDND